MEQIGQEFAGGLGRGLAQLAIIAFFIAIGIFFVSFLIGFWISGRFVKKIKNGFLRVFVRIILGLIFAILILLFLSLLSKIIS
jgi:hypothetical protein